MIDIRVDEDSMKSVIEELRCRGERISEMRALDMFGGDGLRETVYWGKEVKELEIYEVIPHYEEGLKKLFPRAMIKIVDTYEYILSVSDKYDLIVVDNPSSECVGSHYEHFDLFPDIFKLCKDGTILILNVIPTMTYAKESWLDRWRHFMARSIFYGAGNPRALLNVQITQAYARKAIEAGFKLRWHFLRRRSGSDVEWLVLKLAYGFEKGELTCKTV